jgi:signal transduction histidine kinase
MKIHFNSIKLKMTFFYTVILLLLLFLFHFIAYMLLTSGLYNNLRDSLLSDSERAKEIILNSNKDDIPSILKGLKENLDSEVFIYNVVSKEFTGDVDVSDEVKTKLASITYIPDASYLYPMETSYGRILLYVTSIELSTEPDSILCLTRDAFYIHSIVDSYKRMLYMAIPVIILFALLSGFIISSYFLRQVNAITRTAEKIDPSNLVDRIPVKSSDELGRLSKNLNSLFDRIYGFINRQKQFVADASHDLRAPLTNIKAETSLALMRKRSPEEYKDVLKRIDRETEHLNTMVDDLLTLASMDTQPERSRTLLIKLSDFIESILNNWESQYIQKGVKLIRKITPDIEIRGDLLHFNQILDNLLKNALEYTQPGGSVTCSLELVWKDIIITVADTGIGISEKDLPYIFDRFYKVDRDTPGSGLGLPIVEGTVKMYGGRVAVESEVGGGSVFTVVMPAKQPYYITFD